MTKLYLALAFDHELSLGGTDDYTADLFGPTDAILDACASLRIPVTLFSDVLAAIRFREWRVPSFVEPYEAQLERALREGHDVQLHLHPHWLETTFDGARFRPSRRYALADYRNEPYPQNISGIVSMGARFLSCVGKRIDPEYRCVAFRAGGFCLQESAADILRALWDNGLRIDSSIPPGYKFASNVSRVDYSRIPPRKEWHIALDGQLEQESEDGILEVPIATSPRNPLNNAIALARRVIFEKRRPRASGKPLFDLESSAAERAKRLLPFSAWMLSFDYYHSSPRQLLDLLLRYVERCAPGDVILSTVSHPKNMGLFNIRLMEGFVDVARREYGDRLHFCTFRDIYELAVRPAEARQSA